MKYEKPRMELIELVPREVFMTGSPEGGVVIGPPQDGGEDEF